MNKSQLNKFNLPQIPINENYKEKVFSLAASHELSELEDFITTNSISLLKLKTENNKTITHLLLEGESATPENELLRCMKFLVERGAPISSIDKDYLTPLFICIKKKYSEIFKYLLSQHANTDIKTYDNLNVLHEIAKPEHTIFDPKGIQDLIPERLPKITMEGYDDVYKEIQNKVQDIDQNLETFRNIATQFYDIDNKEDFNNILLIDKAIEEPGNIYTVQNELFDKLKNNLLENEKKDVKDGEEEGQLDRLLNELQIEINKDNMLEFNTQLESSILNLAKNLELCIHYFFLKKPENTNIAIEVIIALAKQAKLTPPPPPPPPPNTIIDLIRYILFNSFVAVREVILSIITVSKMDIKDVDKFITEIRQDLVRQIAGQAIGGGAGVGGIIATGIAGVVATRINVISGIGGLISQLIILPTSPQSDATAAIIRQNMINALDPAMNPIAAPELPGVVISVLNHRVGGVGGVKIKTHIKNAPGSTSVIVRRVNELKTEINIAILNISGAINAIAAPGTVPIEKRPAMQLKVLAVLQTAIRSAMYATVYARNEVLALPALAGGPARPKVANISAIYAAVDANVLEVVYRAISAANGFLVPTSENKEQLQDKLQKELSDQKVAIEAIVRATQQIVLAIIGNVGVVLPIAANITIVINAIKQALINIGASENNINTIIDLANKAADRAGAVDADKINAIKNIFITNIDAVREVILAINAATKEKDINNNVIKYIREQLVDTVTAAAGGVMPGRVVMNYIDREINDNGSIFTFIKKSLNITNDEINSTVGKNIRRNIRRNISTALNESINVPELPGVVNSVLNHVTVGGVVIIQTHITVASTAAIDIVQHVNRIKTQINIAIQNIPIAINAIAPANAVPIEKRPAMQLKVLAVLQTAIRSAVHATVYAQNEVEALPPLGGGAAGTRVANISAIYSAVDANVLEGVYIAISAANGFLVERLANQEQLQQELQEALSDQKVAIEAIVRAGQQITLALLGNGIVGGGAIPSSLSPNNAITPDILINAIEKALRIPHFLPQHFKLGNNYNNLIESYKLINIPQRYINFNLTNIYSTEDNTLISKNGVKDYKLPENERSYAIDYFNLLYTFNQYVKNCYVQIDINKNNIFTLYQNIQQIYKYKYIIYIFNKQKEGIEKLLIIIPSSNNDLVKNIKELLEKNYNVLKESVARIENHLSKIITLANECIKSFNNFNASKIEKDIENKISIGIYPEIEKDLNYNKIEYTLDDENEIIANYCRNNYVKYNEYKQFFFHNFVLFFQEIGKYDTTGPNDQNLLNDIPNKMDYNIDINNHTNSNPNTKNKAYKLYFYNPKYLKKHIQEKISDLLGKDEITRIEIQNFKNNNLTIKRNFTNNIKNFILNEILEEKFYTFLTNEINNVFKEKTKKDTRILVYTPNIKKPNLQQIILDSAGFSHSLNPNYEFQNNKFFSISKNRFLEMILYFDTNYFKQTNFDKLEYYKDSKFINNKNKNNLLLKSHLLTEVDMKGWTPIYYAIDGNNYKVIRDMLTSNKDILIKYDNKQKSPIRLCINNQLQHLNYLLNDDDDKKIHFLDNYKEMLRKDLSSNDVLIPLNIDAVFNITLHILNNIFKYNSIQLPNHNPGLINSRKDQIDNEYKKNVTDQKTKTKTVNDRFNNNDNFIKNDLNEIDRPYTPKQNIHYNYINDDETNDILRKYINKARDLEMRDFGSYGTYWNKFKIYKLNHIKISKTLKKELKNLINTQTKNIFNQPEYDNTQINKIKKKLGKIVEQLSNYLNFINIRFNTNKDNAYRVFLNKIYVHVLANIIGVDFYLRIEELIIYNYIDSNIEGIDQPAIINQLKSLNQLLINNKLDSSNINYLYIIEEKNPELVLKDTIKKILESLSLANSIEIINTFETKVYPNYRDLYKITYKYLKMFISNYHKFIYNQYHRLDILILLLNNIS